jgi:hypothetical protein
MRSVSHRERRRLNKLNLCALSTAGRAGHRFPSPRCARCYHLNPMQSTSHWERRRPTELNLCAPESIFVNLASLHPTVRCNVKFEGTSRRNSLRLLLAAVQEVELICRCGEHFDTGGKMQYNSPINCNQIVIFFQTFRRNSCDILARNIIRIFRI